MKGERVWECVLGGNEGERGEMGEGEVGKRECEGDEECLEKQVGLLGGFQTLFEVCV